MKLSKHAEKLLVELHQLDLLSILDNPEFWEKRAGRISKEKQSLLMESLEELEAEGYISMSINTLENGTTLPRKVILKKKVKA